MATKKTTGNQPKTMQELTAILGLGVPSQRMPSDLTNYFKNSSKDILDALPRIEKLVKTEQERLGIYEKLQRYAKLYLEENDILVIELEKQVKKHKDILKIQENQKNAAKVLGKELKINVSKALDSIIKKNQEIYNISHKMQLESNMTWRQYTQLYNQTYEAARVMNKEIGKQLINVKDLVETQNLMLGNGWRGMTVGQLGSLSTQINLMAKTLGEFPQNLNTAFQMSFRQFGDTTFEFVNSLGNRLNAFSDTFGITVQTLTNNVVDMMAANSFLTRNNMQAQIRANESLIRATALSSQVGILTTNFINQLSKTAQFGTASQMSSLYQAGAYLQDFSTYDFQQQLIGQDYEGATSSLISSIYETLSGMEAGYLKNEYMAQIGAGFGLSQEDLLQIMTNGNNLSEYSATIQEKLVDVNKSMEEELKDLKVALIDQLSNLWQNSGISQGLGSLLNNLGLYGISGQLKTIITLMGLSYQWKSGTTVGQSLLSTLGVGAASGGPSASGWLGNKSLMIGGLGVSNAARLGMGLGGAGLAIGSNMLGRSMIEDPSKNSGLGWASNIGGGLLGGALTGGAIGGLGGAAIGGIVGAVGGIFNSASASKERKTAIQEAEDAARARRAEQRSQTVSTGDPVVDAINKQTEVLRQVFKGEFEANRSLQLTLKTLENNGTTI